MTTIRGLLLFVLATLLAASAAASPAFYARGGIEETTVLGRRCRGTAAECLAADGGGGEFELSSEVARRFLATSNYISYDALRRDSVPCSVAGASYYNCRPGAAANPYTRSCSAITQCRS